MILMRIVLVSCPFDSVQAALMPALAARTRRGDRSAGMRRRCRRSGRHVSAPVAPQMNERRVCRTSDGVQRTAALRTRSNHRRCRRRWRWNRHLTAHTKHVLARVAPQIGGRTKAARSGTSTFFASLTGGRGHTGCTTKSIPPSTRRKSPFRPTDGRPI
jgi:hypothetical protein